MRLGIIHRLKERFLIGTDFSWELIKSPSVEIKDGTAIISADVLIHQPIQMISLSYTVKRDGI